MHEVKDERAVSLTPQPLAHELEELAFRIAHNERLPRCCAEIDRLGNKTARLAGAARRDRDAVGGSRLEEIPSTREPIHEPRALQNRSSIPGVRCVDRLVPSLYVCISQAGRGISIVSVRDGMHSCCRKRDADKTAYRLLHEHP